jgi:phosphoglucosamine mutase
MDLRGMRIVVDCANGAGYHIAPHVFHELGRRCCRHRQRAEWLEHQQRMRRHPYRCLSRAVRKHRADVGIALDGDGDRLMMADATAWSWTATS